MTKPDLLPDEIYMEGQLTRTGYLQVDQWSKAPLTSHPLSGRQRAKYIRADLVSTPNKSAEVDLDAVTRIDARFDADGLNCNDIKQFAADWQTVKGRLATGKGGGEHPCKGDPNKNGCEHCEPEHGCKPIIGRK